MNNLDVLDSVLIQKKIETIIETSVTPYIEEWEQQETTPWHLVNLFGKEGVFKKCYSGNEDHFKNKIFFSEALGRINSLGIAATLINHINIPCVLLQKFADEELQSEFLLPSLSGEIGGSIGVTEKSGGSNILQNTNTSIKLQSENIIVNGCKQYVLNGPNSDYCIVLGRTNETTGVLGFSLVVVPLNSPNVRIERIRLGSLNTAGFAKIEINNCSLPKRYLLGEANKGYLQLLPALNEERYLGCVALNSLLKEAIKYSVAYAKNRVFEKSTLANNSVIRHKIAELTAKYQLLNAYLQKIAKIYFTQNKITNEIAIAKLMHNQTAPEIIKTCAQITGGRSYLMNNPLSRMQRDIICAEFFAGTSSVMKELICSHIRL